MTLPGAGGSAPDPHGGRPVRSAGAPLESARAAMIMVHGRGASAGDILSLVAEINRPGFAYLAPEAAGNSWYPYSFLAPIGQNEPYLSSALRALGLLLEQVGAAGVPPDRTILLGFSQGACLALEFAARNARRYGGVVALSGGLIGPPGTPRNYPGNFIDTPIFLGCSDDDPHIPAARVSESAEVLSSMGAVVTARLYERMGHTVNQDEIEFVRDIMSSL